ncbi:MAG TPA: glutathione binding-like protein, partial [Candidatus Binatia bacterium]
PYCVQIMYELRKPEAERDAQRVENARGQIAACLGRIENELEGKDYLVGSFSLADIAFMANLDLLDRFGIPVDASKLKNTAVWIARLKGRPSYAASAT